MARLKVCVTGSTGFLGKHLLNLLPKNDDVEIVPFKGDLLDKVAVESFFNENSDIDTIVHLVGAFFGSADGLIKINAVTTANLLETAVAKGIKKIVYTSTAAVYGEPQNETSKETDQLNPNTAYGLSKKFAEDLIAFYHKFNNLDYVILRFPSLYGEGNNKGVIYNLLDSIEKNKKVTIFGDGEQSRNFLHVSDACRAIEKSLFYQKSSVFNISTAKKYTINEIVELLKQKHQFDVERQPANNNLKDISLDITEAREKLGFEPEIKNLQI